MQIHVPTTGADFEREDLMDRYVAQRNIDRFKALLDKETDPAQRQQIEALLDAEQRKLDELDLQANQAKRASRT